MIKFNYYITRINLHVPNSWSRVSTSNDTYDSMKFKDNGSRRMQRYYHLRYGQNGM